LRQFRTVTLLPHLPEKPFAPRWCRVFAQIVGDLTLSQLMEEEVVA
jgi:hypothetical protein